jgi:hypothetical protein
MTTSYDTDPNTHTIAGACADLTKSIHSDYDTETVATAWSSGPFDQPEDEVQYGIADPAEPVEHPNAVDTRSVAKHVVIAATLACGIGAGAAIGLILGDPSTAQPVVVVPGLGTSPHHAEVVGPSGLAPSSKAAVPVQETAPVYVAPTSTVAPAPTNQPNTAAVATPPVAPPGEATVAVDIPIPDYSPLPEPPKPQDPDPAPPKPPVLEIPTFEPPEVSKPETTRGLTTPRRSHRERRSWIRNSTRKSRRWIRDSSQSGRRKSPPTTGRLWPAPSSRRKLKHRRLIRPRAAETACAQTQSQADHGRHHTQGARHGHR